MGNYKSKLGSLMGRYFRQKSTEVVFRFLEYTKIRLDMVSLRTDSQTFEFSIYDIHVFLENFEEIEVVNEVVTVVAQKSTSVQKTEDPPVLEKSTILQIRDTLMENIKLVKSDASFIPQAKQISNTAQTLINLAVLDLKIKSNL
jgi:hypothetical protein